MDKGKDAEQTSPTSTLRLIFEYKDGVIHLVSQTPLNMVPPSSDGLPAAPLLRGFWTEIQDGEGLPLFRRVMANPIPVDTEVFTGDPSHPIMRVPQAPSEGVFMVLVPQRSDGEWVVLFSSYHRPGPQKNDLADQGIPHATVLPADAGAIVQEIARFPLG